MGYKTLKTEYSQMSPATCLKIEYNFCRVNFYARLLKSILQLNLPEIKRNPIFRTYIILEIAQETKHFNVILFNFCLYISSVNKIRVAPSVCNVKSRLRISQIIYI